MDNRAELILSLRDEISAGLAKVNASLAQTRQEVASLGAAGNQGAAGLTSLTGSSGGLGNALAMAHGHASLMVAQLAALVGVSISLAGAFELVKKGIEEINQFNLGAVATAAMMLSRANIEGLSDQRTAYGEYKAYVLNMYHALEEETQRHFATGQEMIGTFNAFARQGIYAAKEEAGAVGVVTDAVRLLHGGYIDQLTAMHEIRGVLEGHAGMHYRLAQVLESQIGPDWKNIVQLHMQDGTLLTFMAEQFKGLSVASGDIQQTLTAQSTTLYTILGQVGRGGLADAYADIVGWNRQTNDYLRAHKEEISGGIARGWTAVKDLVYGTYGAVKLIYDILSTHMVWTIQIYTSIIGPAAKWLASGGGAGGTYKVEDLWGNKKKVTIGPSADFGFGGLGPDTGEGGTAGLGAAEFKFKQNQALAEAAAKYKAQTYQKYLEEQAKPPPWAPPQPAAPGGGKSAEGAENSMLTLVDRLNQEIAKMSEGGIAAIDAWFNKTVDDIDKLVAKGAEGSEAMALAEQSAALKKEKVTDDFYQAMAKEAGDAYMTIDNWQEKSLKDWRGARDEVTGQAIDVSAWVNQTADKKYYEQSLKDWEKMTSLQEKYLSGLASASPFLSQQVALEAEALPFQEALAQSKLKDLIYHEKLNDEWRISRGLAALMTPQMEKQLRDLEAQTEELKRQALALKDLSRGGVLEGLQLWSYDRLKASETAITDTVKDAMNRAEKYIATSFGDGVYAGLFGETGAFQRMRQELLKSAFQELFKFSVKQTFDLGAKLVPGLDKLLSPQNQAYQHQLSAAIKLEHAAGSLQSAANRLSSSGEVIDDASGSMATGSQGLSDSADVSVKASGESYGSSIAQGLAATSLVAGGIGMLTGSQTLMVAATAISMAAALLEIGAALDIFPWHEGGLVAHQGLLVAHGGLNTDERLIKAQVGEGILPLSVMRRLGSSGFEALRRGNFTTPERQTGGGEFHYHDNSVLQIGDRADKEDFKRLLRQHRQELVRIMREEHRNFVRV